MKFMRSFLVTGAALALAATALTGAAAPSAADSGPCWVKNLRTKVVTTDLQSAVTEPGDTLRVRGTCGSFTASHDLTLVGPATLAWPVCETCGASNLVMVDAGVKLTLTNIRLTNGSSTYYGGAILNYGAVILRGSTAVTGNRAEDGGGGIYNEGLLVMKDRSTVTANSLLYGYGGGVWNRGTMIMQDHAGVARNSGVFGGGIYNAGTLVMRDWSAVKGNSGETGGGVHNTGKLVLKGWSSITRNTASGGSGGGILAEGTVDFSRFWKGTVCGNTPDDWGRCSSCARPGQV